MRKRWECRCLRQNQNFMAWTSCRPAHLVPSTSTRAPGVAFVTELDGYRIGETARFIRSLSATPFILRALNPHDRSSSSGLTSTYIPLMTSPQPEKRKVAGSIPALATRIDARCTQAHGPTRIHHGDELRETAEVLCLKLFGA
jgi:hypothetical protein